MWLLLRAVAFALGIGFFATTTIADADELVMFEAAGCPFCAEWNHEVGDVYSVSSEAKRLPLRRVDLHGLRAQDLRSIAGVTFTPTFVVMHCGAEALRIVGYRGSDLFWQSLDAAMASVPATPCPPAGKA